MFYQARLKLTIFYSLIFLVLFWSISLGIYLWMNRFFGDEQGRNYSIRVHHERSLLENNGMSTEPSSDIVMDELRNVLLFLDVVVLFGIPTVTWFLTGSALAPVQKTHEREKRFLTDASHDLRTPLSILSGELEVMLQKERTKEEYKKTLQSNKEEVDDLTTLVENMLFFARENKQYQNMQKEQVDLTDLLAERVATFQQSTKQKKLQLLFIPPEQSIVINGNLQLLKRLFTSLLDNAIKYTPIGGKIRVKLRNEKHMVLINIVDTGIGIPEEQHEQVFDRFFRADTSRGEKGYGLGLSIAKEIVEYHDGKIQLDSKVGKGTTITLSFLTSTQNQERNLT